MFGRTKHSQLYLKSAEEIARMRRAGIILNRVMKEVIAATVEGATGLELDKLAHSRIREAGARPAFLHLYGFPNTLCISLNEAVVHGIPSKQKFVSGDIVSLDCGLVLDGFYSDMAHTVPVGDVTLEAQQLLRVTQESLFAGISKALAGGRVGDIGTAIENHIRPYGYFTAEGYTGHGIGRSLHEEPQVLNSSAERGKKMLPGLVIAIEPMVNIGTGKTQELSDHWTVVTKDRSLSAHYEHTVAVTEDGPLILTAGEESAASTLSGTGS